MVPALGCLTVSGKVKRLEQAAQRNFLGPDSPRYFAPHPAHVTISCMVVFPVKACVSSCRHHTIEYRQVRPRHPRQAIYYTVPLSVKTESESKNANMHARAHNAHTRYN